MKVSSNEELCCYATGNCQLAVKKWRGVVVLLTSQGSIAKKMEKWKLASCIIFRGQMAMKFL